MARRPQGAAEVKGTKAKRKPVDVPPISSRDDAMKALASVASTFGDDWRRPVEVLKRVRAVPTIMPAYDFATRVGGHPTDRVSLVHGPSGEGKTYFCAGIGLSFLRRMHFFGMIDAERTSPITWFEAMYGADAASPLFVASRPPTYEDTVEAVESFCMRIGDAKVKGLIPKETSGVIVIDSVKKLVPKKLKEIIDKDVAKNGMDGLSGRMGQYKAQLNGIFMDRIVPVLDQTGTALVLIARETKDANATTHEKNRGEDWIVGGGAALIFDASIQARVELGKLIYDREYVQGGDNNRTLYGERHDLKIHKTKVSAKMERVTVGNFHTSNGAWVPEGFDGGRDLVELGKRLGVVKTTGGGWHQFGGKKWRSSHSMVKDISVDPKWFAKLDEAVRGRFDLDTSDEAAETIEEEEAEA